MCDEGGCRWSPQAESDVLRVEIGEKEGCRNVSKRSDSYRSVEGLARALLDAAPARIVECRDGRDRVRVVRYRPLEQFEEWRKEVEVQCDGDAEESGSVDCKAFARAVRADRSEQFMLAPGMPLSLALELRALIASQVPGARVVGIAYNAVADGGEWSSKTQGYIVAAEGGLEHSAGAYYQVVERCVSGSCVLHVMDDGPRRSWSY